VRPLAAVVAPMLHQRRVGRERLGAGLALGETRKKKHSIIFLFFLNNVLYRYRI
jgi:hypothetical protein